MNKNDRAIVFEDFIKAGDKHGLIGEISIYRKNKTTGEKVRKEHQCNFHFWLSVDTDEDVWIVSGFLSR